MSGSATYSSDNFSQTAFCSGKVLPVKDDFTVCLRFIYREKLL